MSRSHAYTYPGNEHQNKSEHGWITLSVIRKEGTAGKFICYGLKGLYMNTYTRSTRECTFADLGPELVTAIRKHIDKYKLKDIESTIRICCETTSTTRKSGLFTNGSETTITGMLVTAQLLIWTTIGKKKDKSFVRSARLRNLDVQDFENTAMYHVNPDSGMNITGRYTDVTKQGQTFIGLGKDPAGEKFRQVLQHAIQRAQA